MTGSFSAKFLTAVACLHGCNSTGACQHVYEDPVLVIARVDGSGSGPLAAVTISDVVIAGQAVGNLGSLTAAPAFGLSLANGELRCAISCGFGVVEGRYEFLVKGPGYRDRQVTTTASYSTFEGGCPSRNSGTTRITVLLEPGA